MCVHDQSLICAPLLVTLWTVTLQVLLPMELSRQENWSELLFPCPGMVPSQGLNPCLLHLLHWQADFFFLPLGPLGKPRKAPKVPQKTKPGPSHLQKAKLLSRIWLFATPWTVAYQAPPSMGFSRQEYWSGLPFPSPGRKIFWPKIRTQVSHIIGRRFIIWATRDVHLQGYHNLGKEDRGPELVTGGGKKKKEIN